MTRILCIETSTSICSVCLSQNGAPWIIREEIDFADHAAQVTVFIQEILNTASLSITDIDAVAVSKGPGSFTGLRIGAAAAKGICFARQIPLIAVDTLHALENGLHQNPLLSQDYICLTAMDARRNNIFAAVWNNAGDCLEKPHFETLTEESYSKYLKQNIPLYVVGNGAEKVKISLGAQEHLVVDDTVYASAKNMTQLAYAAFQNENFEDVAYFEPFYMRPPHITQSKKKTFLNR